jgi:hypothetical protein
VKERYHSLIQMVLSCSGLKSILVQIKAILCRVDLDVVLTLIKLNLCHLGLGASLIAVAL